MHHLDPFKILLHSLKSFL